MWTSCHCPDDGASSRSDDSPSDWNSKLCPSCFQYFNSRNTPFDLFFSFFLFYAIFCSLPSCFFSHTHNTLQPDPIWVHSSAYYVIASVGGDLNLQFSFCTARVGATFAIFHQRHRFWPKTRRDTTLIRWWCLKFRPTFNSTNCLILTFVIQKFRSQNDWAENLETECDGKSGSQRKFSSPHRFFPIRNFFSSFSLLLVRTATSSFLSTGVAKCQRACVCASSRRNGKSSLSIKSHSMNLLVGCKKDEFASRDGVGRSASLKCASTC